MDDHAPTPAHPWLARYPDGIDWSAPLPTGRVDDVLDRAVARFGDAVALDFMDKTTTYRELAEQTERAAAGFQRLGVGPGVQVGLFLPNCPYYPIAFFGVLKAGGTVVNFNPLYAEREVLHQIEDAQVDIMVTLDVKATYDTAHKVLDKSRLKTLVICPMADILPSPKNWLFPIVKRKDVARVTWDSHHVRWADLVSGTDAPRDVKIDPATDVAVLQYTGGTTGVPKGAMLTHANLTANIEQSRLWFKDAVDGEEVVLCTLPFFHVFAMTVALGLGLTIGARLVLMPRFELDECLRLVTAKKVTLFPAVPTIYTAINNHRSRDKFDLTSIRMCISGGAPLPADVRESFERLTGCWLAEGYGLTEASPVVTCQPLDGSGGKPGSIGLPLPGTEIDIVSLDDRASPVALGERGEVCVRGPQVMKGYWHRPDETADTIVNGRLHTADVGYMDEDGYVFLVDRIKDLIIAGGYNVYPRMVEEAVYLHPAVEECIVAGVPDKYRGETVKAWVKLRDDSTLTESELKAFLKDKLSPIEMPKHIEFRDQPLPKTMIGKLSRKDILAEEEAAR